jgi:hypothetical protein
MLNLDNNLIPYVDTLVFVNRDGTPRFPNLQYLNLANNRILSFDLLFPLTIPSSQMNLDFSLNPIGALENFENLNFNLPVFSYAVVDNRSVNLRGNQLTTFDDSNLIQYGLQTEPDLQTLLYKISNYDLRQANDKSIIVCTCPSGSQFTSIWYANLLNKQLVNTSTLINQLYCSNIGTGVYILNFNCIVSFSGYFNSKIKIHNLSKIFKFTDNCNHRKNNVIVNINVNVNIDVNVRWT